MLAWDRPLTNPGTLGEKLQAVSKKSVVTLFGTVKLATGGGKAISVEVAKVTVLLIG